MLPHYMTEAMTLHLAEVSQAVLLRAPSGASHPRRYCAPIPRGIPYSSTRLPSCSSSAAWDDTHDYGTDFEARYTFRSKFSASK